MNLQQGGSRNEFVATGGLNRVVGWTMLVVGMALAALLDPWFFAAQSASEFANSIRPAIRHVQGVVLGMAVLQLAMAHLLATSAFDRRACQTVALWITSGTAIYTIGYALGLAWPSCHWLVLLGSGLNFRGFAYLLWVKPSGEFAPQIRMVLRVVCLGMLLDFVAGVFQVLPPQFTLEHFGGDDGVRLRMMRLARVAMILLSTLTLLYYGVARRAEQRTARWGGLALAWGAIGMPSILAAACFTSLYLKYLLMLPSTAVLIGVFLGLTFALRYASPLEGWGWALIAGSTSVGMLMGLYAFDGPLRVPEFLGEYNQMPRRLSRLAHSYCIVLGVLAIFLAREFNGKSAVGGFARLGVPLFVVGSALTVSILAAQIVVPLSPYMLSLGPALAVIGMIISLKVTVFRKVGQKADSSAAQFR